MGKQAQRPPELYRIIFPVKDIKKAYIFYSKLLDLKSKKVSPGRVYFECGQTILARYDPVADGDSLHSGWNLHPKQYIYFSIADLDSTFEKYSEDRWEGFSTKTPRACPRHPWVRSCLECKREGSGPMTLSI